MVNYLGHIISDQSSSMKDQVQAIRAWAIPENKKHAQCFRCLVDLYRRFIKCMGSVAAHLTRADRKSGLCEELRDQAFLLTDTGLDHNFAGTETV